MAGKITDQIEWFEPKHTGSAPKIRYKGGSEVIGKRWEGFDFTGPNEYVDSVIRKLKDRLRPYLIVEPSFEWVWRTFPFHLGMAVQDDEPPFRIFINPQLAELWDRDRGNAAKMLCWTVAHEFYHIYAGIAEKAWYDETAASRFASDFSGISAREYNKLEHELLRPTAMEREYWRKFGREVRGHRRVPPMPPELEAMYGELNRKWSGKRKV